MIKKLFRYIWAIWGLIIFLLSLIIVTPVYSLIFLTLGQKGGKIAHKLSRLWAWALFCTFFIRVKKYNSSILDPAKTYVFVSNHISQLDIPACALSNRHYFKFLSKVELTRIPLLGFIIKNLYITVSRKSKDDRARSVEKMDRAIKDNISVFIYPEGTRNRTDQPLKTFYDGAFKTAIDTQSEIAVLTLCGTGKLLPVDESFQLSPGTIRCYWEKTISTRGLTYKDIPRIKEEVAELMTRRLTGKEYSSK